MVTLSFSNGEFDDLLANHITPAIAPLSPNNRVVIIRLGARFARSRLLHRFPDAEKIDPNRPVTVVSYAQDASAIQGIAVQATTTIWTTLPQVVGFDGSSVAN
ncbi:hypothetical protein HDV00_012793, partial [Rhizophlyctis rosea]